MKTTTIRYRKLPDGTRYMGQPIRCIGANVLTPCEAEATWCRDWQTTAMAGPAFWYMCAEHAADAARQDGISLD